MMVEMGAGRDGDEPFENSDYETETADLGLVEDDGPLPWLESDYDDEEEGYDTGRLVGFALLGLLVLVLLIGAIWWLTKPGADPDLIAEGGTIEAPDGPIKERPENAGGKIFAGTGDVAPGVGEGQSSEGTIAADTPAGSGDKANSSESDKVGVQIGAFSSRESAVSGWNTLRGQTDALSGFGYRVVEGKADIGTVYRLQALAEDVTSANALCSALKSDGVQCQVKR